TNDPRPNFSGGPWRTLLTCLAALVLARAQGCGCTPVFVTIGALDELSHLVLADRGAATEAEHDVEEHGAQREQLGEEDAVGLFGRLAVSRFQDDAAAPLAQTETGSECRGLDARVLDLSQLGPERPVSERAFHDWGPAFLAVPIREPRLAKSLFIQRF